MGIKTLKYRPLLKDESGKGIQGFEYDAIIHKLPQEYSKDAEYIIDGFFSKIESGLRSTEQGNDIIESNKMYTAIGFQFGVEWARARKNVG